MAERVLALFRSEAPFISAAPDAARAPRLTADLERALRRLGRRRVGRAAPEPRAGAGGRKERKNRTATTHWTAAGCSLLRRMRGLLTHVETERQTENESEQPSTRLGALVAGTP